MGHFGNWIRWGRWFSRPAARCKGRVAAAAADTAGTELQPEPERPWGCGWFDSSHDLQEGLAVYEHDGVDLTLAVRQMLQPERSLC